MEPDSGDRDKMPAAGDIPTEWRALRARDYDREGIATIVGIETVGAAAPGGGDAPLAAAFRTLARDLAPTGADPAGVLELLAERRLRSLA